jgi:hypothetical protein
VKLDVKHPNVVDFQNNVLSWIGPKFADILNKNMYDFGIFIESDKSQVFKRLVRHCPKDIASNAPDEI